MSQEHGQQARQGDDPGAVGDVHRAGGGHRVPVDDWSGAEDAPAAGGGDLFLYFSPIRNIYGIQNSVWKKYFFHYFSPIQNIYGIQKKNWFEKKILHHILQFSNLC